MSIISAVYENGVFRPTVPVALPEGTHVRVEVEISRPSQPGATRQHVLEILGRSYETGDPRAAERHNEHQP